MTVSGVQTIGLIGAGLIGSQVARLAVANGYRVMVANLRGPETLTDGRPRATEHRRALAIAADDDSARAQVADLLDEFGFDTVDAGTLADSWRIEPGTPGYGPRLDALEMKTALDGAVRPAR